jgi:hypothetical protein
MIGQKHLQKWLSTDSKKMWSPLDLAVLYKTHRILILKLIFNYHLETLGLLIKRKSKKNLGQ